MDEKNTSTTQSLRRVAIFAILVVVCAVIYSFYLSNERQCCNKNKNDIKQSLPQTDGIKTESIRAKPTHRPTELRSTAQFLDQIKSLTLDDFVPINNLKAEDLKLSEISTFNNLHLGPRIQSMVRMDYFKYVKLNLQRGCTLWPDGTKCSLK